MGRIAIVRVVGFVIAVIIRSVIRVSWSFQVDI